MKRLSEIIRKRKTFAIAFSGGVDSTFLAALAKNVCKEGVVAITADSNFYPREELKSAIKIAELIGIKHFIVKVDLMDDSNIIMNSKERCYFCKKRVFDSIKNKAMELGFETLAHGANIDDLQDYRPGLKAAKEMDIFSPLIEAKMTKSQIRLASKEMGLSTWDMPTQSCLATRIPYNQKITVEKLSKIEACEHFLNQLGFLGIRVRYHSDMSNNDIARIESPQQSIHIMAERDVRDRINSFFKAHGFKFVSLNLTGYISGSMNY
ncbi:MAG: ATP-dependent sacrificial sulfur transferase LarE [Desulfamplus sp.]|nr:ATP-dependent sacrificial sulfur transferase LarE [Desulfamplus sp.]